MVLGEQEQRHDEWAGGDARAAASARPVDERRSWLFRPAGLVVLGIGLFALGFLAYWLFATRDDGESREASGGADTSEVADDDSATETATDDADETSPSTDANTTDANTDGADDTSSSSGDELAPIDTIEGAFIDATLDLDAGPTEGLFVLSGRVPDDETATAVLGAAELSYAPYVQSNLEVDETLEPAPWLESAPQLIGLLPIVTDGTVRLVDGGIQIDVRSGELEWVQRLEGALGQLSGLPVDATEHDITNLSAPHFEAEALDGDVTLRAALPSQEIVDFVLAGAHEAYGADNVTSEMTVEPDLYTSFWMYTLPVIFQSFSPFSRYTIGVENGVSYGTLQGGVTFDVDSTEIGEEAATVLDVGVAILARDVGLFMTVRGHTDSDGPSDYNQDLSLARAESVVAYFEAAGIDGARLIPIGAGEEEPIASNDTEAGRAENRRVEFLFGPPDVQPDADDE